MRRAITVINNPQNTNYNVWQIGNNISLYDWNVLSIDSVSGLIVTLGTPADAAKISVGDIVFGGTLPSPPANPATVTGISGDQVTLSHAPGSVTSLTFGSPALRLSTVEGGQHTQYKQGSLVMHNPQNANNAPNTFTPGSLGINPTAVFNNLNGVAYRLVVYVNKSEGLYGLDVNGHDVTIETSSVAGIQQEIVGFFNRLGATVTVNTPTSVVAVFNTPGLTIGYSHNGGAGSVTTFVPGDIPTGEGAFLRKIYEGNLENEYTGKSKIETGFVYRIYYAKSVAPVKSLTGGGGAEIEHVILVNNAVVANANSYHTRITALLT